MTLQHLDDTPVPAPSDFIDQLNDDRQPDPLADLINTMVQSSLQHLLREEVARHIGAERGQRTAARTGYRNGTKPRTLATRVGRIQLEMPQVRDAAAGAFRTQLFDRYERSEKALVAAMQEMVVAGVSTRRVADVLQEMGGFEVSAATVSRAMAEIDEQIERHFSRRLDAAAYRFVIVDARYEKVRVSGRVTSQAVLVAAGINADGRREVLSLMMGDSESADTWGTLFSGLKARGLRGVELVVSDAHAGLAAAIGKHLQGVAWQRCRVHFIRELLAKASYKDYKELAGDLRAVYASAEPAQCLAAAEEVARKWDKRAGRMSAALRAGVESTLTVTRLDLPSATTRRLHSTNMLERAMKTIKARTRSVGSFCNASACRRLVGAVLLEIQDRWDQEVPRYVTP